ncbi:hypothetical protein AALO_G00129500 [Alosa alosa]|uniref:Uncharacterized protein n=1 Tax=Alosa alosa TaxID=278164 RepID=A0AAV6GM72_9TELE|nr:hypothetical protein AALO_G00129500 [Alosa alosa]
MKAHSLDSASQHSFIVSDKLLHTLDLHQLENFPLLQSETPCITLVHLLTVRSDPRLKAGK